MLLPAQSLPRSPASASADSAESFANALLKSTTKFHRRLDEVDLLNMRDFLQVPVSTSIFYSPRTAPSFSNAPLPLAFPSAQISAKTRKQDFALLASPLPLSTCPPHRQPASLVLPSANCLAAHLPKPLASACAQQRTVMLCVEPEHQGQAPEGFSVQAVDVTVGGAGCACAPSSGGCPKSPLELFPLHLSAHERSNFLFAVDLVGLPISEEEALHVVPKPPLLHGNDAGSRAKGGTEERFLTKPFPLRWNCVSDPAPQRSLAVGQTNSSVLPEPLLQFPTISTLHILSTVPERTSRTQLPLTFFHL
ncbi:hypothetical protein EDB86DRAFT_3075393 [Lactarius hatsudake]|nr:hypothetical protein EDB86DRAFT_3075393 [Lactarius hatsudake]